MTDNRTEGRLKSQGTRIYEDRGELLASIAGYTANAVERAARIALAYNACLSVPLDDLERIDVGRLVEAARRVLPFVAASGYCAHAELRAALGETDR